MKTSSSRNYVVFGILAALCTVTSWTTWIIVSRIAMRGTQPLDPILLTFIRFGTGAVLLSPIWLKFRLIPKGAPFIPLVGLLCAGLPYQYFVLTGLHFSSASIAGPLLTGTLPLFVAILSVTVLREQLTLVRILGTLFITCGVFVILGNSLFQSDTGALKGGLLLLAASLSWSIYTISFKASGLKGFQATSFVSLWSVLLLLPFYTGHIITAWKMTPSSDIVVQILVQGVMAGILALVTFTVAVKYLGPSNTTVITALTPVVVNIVSVIVLGESAEPTTIIGCICIVLGVMTAAGAHRVVSKVFNKGGEQEVSL